MFITPTKEQFEEILKALNIRYDGEAHGLHYWTDLETKSSFIVKEMSQKKVKKRLEEVRKSFKKEGKERIEKKFDINTAKCGEKYVLPGWGRFGVKI